MFGTTHYTPPRETLRCCQRAGRALNGARIKLLPPTWHHGGASPPASDQYQASFAPSPAPSTHDPTYLLYRSRRWYPATRLKRPKIVFFRKKKIATGWPGHSRSLLNFQILLEFSSMTAQRPYVTRFCFDFRMPIQFVRSRAFPSATCIRRAYIALTACHFKLGDTLHDLIR